MFLFCNDIHSPIYLRLGRARAHNINYGASLQKAFRSFHCVRVRAIFIHCHNNRQAVSIEVGLTHRTILFCVSLFFFGADFVQSVYGSLLATKEIEYGYWPPAAIVDAYAWWCKNVDVLLAHNPIWLVVQSPSPIFPSHV